VHEAGNSNLLLLCRDGLSLPELPADLQRVRPSSHVVSTSVQRVHRARLILILEIRLANLTQASQVLNYVFMATTYLCFYQATKVQGLDRNTLPYKGWLQPFCGWYSLVSMTTIVVIYGYTVFLPGCKLR
jgi:hypothetical protein